MNGHEYALLMLSGMVGLFVAVVAFALLRVGAAARDTNRRLQSGDSALLSAALQDAVTKLRASEREMTARAEASERLSSEIVASLSSGLLVVSLEGEVLILNPAGRRLLGRDLGPGPASYHELLSGKDALADVVQQCLVSGEAVVRKAVRLDGPDGTTTHLGVTVSRLRDAEARATGAICLFTDLTAIVELEDQLRMKDALARLGELTAGLAHEFRNGLATIHGYARLIALESLDDRNRQFVQGIRAETDALGRIVTNFLAFARPADVALHTVDLGSLVEGVAGDTAREMARPDGHVQVRGAFGAIQGDEVLLRQAFSNLLRNAVEACARAGVAPEIVIEGDVDAEHGLLKVRVTDNGPGIERALRDRVFRPFFTTRRDGTGLGLALVQKIVVTHNGRVTVGGPDHGGAVFEITLPVAA